MPRTYKILGFLFVTFLGTYGCAKGPGTPSDNPVAARAARLEEECRAATSARDQFKQKFAAAEALAAKTKKDLEQLEVARLAVASERDALKAEVKNRTGERDALQAQYDGFRKTLRDMIGSADAAVGKLNLPPPAPAATTLSTSQN